MARERLQKRSKREKKRSRGEVRRYEDGKNLLFEYPIRLE